MSSEERFKVSQSDTSSKQAGRILLAHAKQVILDAMSEVLGSEGYECDCARTGASALAKLRTGKYDLLVADQQMPGNTQLEIVRNLPRAGRDIPVILYTDDPSLDWAMYCIELNVAAYLLKPMEVSELLTYVRRALKYFRPCRSPQDLLRKAAPHVFDPEISPRDSLDPSASLESYTDATLKRIGVALEDLRYLMCRTESVHLTAPPCHLLDCPRLARLTRALKDTVAVLEKTKRAFKSKDLAALRKTIETVLDKNSRRKI